MAHFTLRTARIIAALALSVLAGCTVEEYPGPRPEPMPRPPQMCTMEYAPVCGVRGRQRETFSNSCQARARGFDVIGRGECRDEGRPERPDDRPQICTREYNPVCARRGNRTQTFSNSCMAESDGFRVIGRGECRSNERPGGDIGMPGERPESRPGVCTREYAPVCGRRGNRTQTFPNSCMADAEGFRVIDNNACR
ncbi:hypothetical protein QO002_002755 [Pararhizobium capsulatum DSM 1112]|uniref:Kazal-like domain-containing protein n=1 Tax=Pararhizobium capsulatum DSM 1112 TaxID=1121113 RepID=A0ABU0BUV1_9HYPH|nr:hypothetical protein [Pararhizobium capsulatum DSM 1112]